MDQLSGVIALRNSVTFAGDVLRAHPAADTEKVSSLSGLLSKEGVKAVP